MSSDQNSETSAVSRFWNQTPVRTAAAFLGAAGVTAVVVWTSTTQTLRAQVEDGLKLARQIAAQGEAIVLDSYTASARDPLGRAAELLSQGIDPRLIKVTKVERISETVWPTLGQNRVPAGVRERWSMNTEFHRFDFWKILSDETGSGIRVSVTLPFPGVLGTRTQGANDFAVMTVFGLVLAILILSFRRTSTAVVASAEVSAEAPAQPAPAEIETASNDPAPTAAQVIDAAIRERLLIRVHQMHETLIGAGKHVREVVRTAKDLTDATVDTRETLIELRTGVHQGLSDLRESAQALRQWERSFGKVDAILAKERSTTLSPDEFAYLKKAIAESRACWDHLAKLERVIEPWTLGLDMAVSGSETFFGRTDEMNAEVRKAMLALIEENKLVTQIKTELTEANASPAASLATSKEGAA